MGVKQVRLAENQEELTGQGMYNVMNDFKEVFREWKCWGSSENSEKIKKGNYVFY